MIDAYASHPHLVDHLAPVWAALPAGDRGRFMVAHRPLVAYARDRHGIDTEWAVPHAPGGPVLVANHSDYTQVHPDRQVAYLEHGAGQTYADIAWHPAYSGGQNRDRVAVFLTLNETTAARERAAYPAAEVIVVGSPRLDALAADLARAPVSGAIACAWHWRCNVVPEAMTAFAHWKNTYADLARQGTPIIGHAHPRLWREVRPWYERRGIIPEADLAGALRHAEVLTFDNTSAGYEAAALGIPVVALNAPWYRRDVHHGLRFWDQVPGPQADEPDALLDACAAALSDEWARRRAEVTAAIYPEALRGRSARVAADACLTLLVRSA